LLVAKNSQPKNKDKTQLAQPKTKDLKNPKKEPKKENKDKENQKENLAKDDKNKILISLYKVIIYMQKRKTKKNQAKTSKKNSQ